MAFADPQSVTIGGTATPLPRTFFKESEGKFTSSDQATQLRVSHAYGRRIRRLARLDNQKISADPLNPNINVPSSMSVSIVVDVPVQGYTPAEQKAVVDAVMAWATASTGVNITKLLGGES